MRKPTHTNDPRGLGRCGLAPCRCSLPAAILLVVGSFLACSAEQPVEKIKGQIVHDLLWKVSLVLPEDSSLKEDLAAAIEFRKREDHERLLDASDPGELKEHATMTQTELQRATGGLPQFFAVGDSLFEFAFRRVDGLGNGLANGSYRLAGPSAPPNLRRVHYGEFGGPDAHSCATCHSKGGPDGAGTNTQNAFLRGDGDSTVTADQRNAPHLLGLGPIEALATEMSKELQSQLNAAKVWSASHGKSKVQLLESKGVSFGEVRVEPSGQVDRSGIEGVDSDLRVRPFGWKGHQATIRAMVKESFRIHLGIMTLADHNYVRDGGDASNLGDGPWFDPDRDGAMLELDDGMLTTMVAYLAQLEVPVIHPLPESWRAKSKAGRRLFHKLGCATCHRPMLPLVDPIIQTSPELAEYADVPPLRINTATDGEQPKIALSTEFKGYEVDLFSDLRRHDMGRNLATRAGNDGIPPSHFLTRPLWGLADTAPFLHDGRAPTVHDAIMMHGGEASQSRGSYAALDDTEQNKLKVFLLSMGRSLKLFVP